MTEDHEMPTTMVEEDDERMPDHLRNLSKLMRETMPGKMYALVSFDPDRAITEFVANCEPEIFIDMMETFIQRAKQELESIEAEQAEPHTGTLQ